MDKAPNAAPAFLQLMAVVAEVGGGALLIVGLLTPIATFLIACDMAGALALVLGPGRYSLDAMLFKRRDWVAEEKKEWLKIPAA